MLRAPRPGPSRPETSSPRIRPPSRPDRRPLRSRRSLGLERLEGRTLLSIAPELSGEAAQASPVWFQGVTAPAQAAAPAIRPSGAGVRSILWAGRPTDVAADEWL